MFPYLANGNDSAHDNDDEGNEATAKEDKRRELQEELARQKEEEEARANGTWVEPAPVVEEQDDERSIMSLDSMGSLQSQSNIPKYEGIEKILGREKMAGEKYLDANTTMWNELFSPPGGCQKQKNPLNLVFVTGIVKDDVEEL